MTVVGVAAFVIIEVEKYFETRLRSGSPSLSPPQPLTRPPHVTMPALQWLVALRPCLYWTAGDIRFVKRKGAVLIAVAIFVQDVARASPPEYLAGSREPATSASEEISPIEEPTPQLSGLRLGLTNEPFFRDAVISLQPRIYYRYTDEGGSRQEAVATGGALILTSGWWRETLQLGIAGYTSQPIATGHDPGGTGLLRPNGDELSVLGQAWAKLHFGSATTTLFRQEMELPFINADDSRMIPNMFEAYRLDVNPSDVIHFGIAYITREKSRTSEEFRPMSEVAGVKGVDRGTSVAGFIVGSKEGDTYFGAINELTWDLFNIAYVEAARTWKLPNDFQLRASAQFIDQQSVGDALLGGFATQLYGASVVASYRSAVLTLAFTGTANGSNVRSPFGGVAAFNSLMISDFDAAGENSGRVGLSYDFARLGLNGVKAFANYAHGEFVAGHEDEINVTGDYRIDDGPLKNLWLRVRYGHNWTSNRPETNDVRVTLNYTFTR